MEMRDFQPFDERLARHIFVQVIKALEYCHSKGICHRDVKLENLLLNEAGMVKLIDFGIARKYKEGQLMDTVQIGTTGFAAPEQFENTQSDHRTDLFSLGAMM
jgi:serine/threonine-protein kinase